ncbi:type VI secretion system protein TssA [Buttiauxella gaviniae]|uniref:type VI secretion system protein TssA n=1 Tax=Buttiauxella gaviniae TaxID=82990 RepID=UPI003977030E
MTTERSFNLEALLQPISTTDPSGSNIEYESIYERIRQARESDPDYLPQDEWSTTPRKADWMLVAKLSEEVLIQHSKDWQVACWLVEAWSQLYQAAGLKAGLELIDRLISHWWHRSWPALDEEGASYRHGILSRLDRDISQQLRLKPIMADVQSSLNWWQQVLSFEHQATQSDDTPPAEDYSMASFIQWASKRDPAQVAAVVWQIDGSQQLIEQLEKNYAQYQPQSEGRLLHQTIEQLNDLHDFLLRINQHCSAQQQEEIMMLNVLDPDGHSVGEGNNTRAAQPAQVMSRDLAITQMLTIAHFFRQTEPSSPVPMLMERAARWANMPLSEWLVEMVGDERSLAEINFVLNGPSR